MTATSASVPGTYVGASGWSYPTWKPGFYPRETQPRDFLRFYAERLPTVELNTTGYRLPAEEQFRRWAEQAPSGFLFSPKLPAYRLDGIGTFCERVGLLGDSLGPIRVVVPSVRDDGMLELLLGSLDPGLRFAFDLRHASWDGVEQRLVAAGATRVDWLEGEAPFRYLRLREPPYDESQLAVWAERLRPIAEPLFVYFRHEDEPTAPAYAQRLLELLR